MKTAIVILNWNGRDFLKKYLPSVLYSIHGMEDVDVVVADNASNDDSIELLKSKFPSVKTICMKKNHGFAGGYNRALAKLEYDLFVLLNSDVEVPDGWLEPLTEWMSLHDDCGICGPKLHQIDDRDMFEYAGAAGGFIDKYGYPFCNGRVMKRIERDEGQYDTPREVFWISGAALAIRSELFKKLGGFNDDFFAHMEEIDLCWRARINGWKVSIVPRSVVYHVGGGSLPQDSPRKLFLNYRNNLYMLQNNLPYSLALEAAFNIMAKAVLPDDGPDMFANCGDVWEDNGSEMQQSMVEVSAEYAIMKTKKFIAVRMLLDTLAAFVYRLQGHKDYAKAVNEAHDEFLKNRIWVSEKKLKRYVADAFNDPQMRVARTVLTDETDTDNLGEKDFKIKGMWKKWIVWQSVLQKDAIFADINDKLV